MNRARSVITPFISVLGALAFFAQTLDVAAAPPVYAQDFSKAAPGSQPEDLLILDGQFTVKEEAGNRFFELPGAPLESFGFLFGPSEQSGFEVSARIFGSRQGRKFPTLAIGLNGASGYRLQVSPAKKALELLKGETSVASAAFDWKSGEWTELRLRIVKGASGGFRVEGRAWPASGSEPAQAQVTLEESQLQPAGKAGAWGMPYSGTPILFDDLKLTPVP
jgi:hypothetical protein